MAPVQPLMGHGRGREGVCGLVISVVMLWTTACARPEARALDRFQDAIRTALASAPAAVLDLNRITDFAWDRMLVFPPYSPRETISQELGSNALGMDIRGIDYRDDICLLVFTRQGRLVRVLELPRGLGDLSSAYLPKGYSPRTAVFRVSREGERTVISPVSPPRR